MLHRSLCIVRNSFHLVWSFWTWLRPKYLLPCHDHGYCIGNWNYFSTSSGKAYQCLYLLDFKYIPCFSRMWTVRCWRHLRAASFINVFTSVYLIKSLKSYSLFCNYLVDFLLMGEMWDDQIVLGSFLSPFYQAENDLSKVLTFMYK